MATWAIREAKRRYPELPQGAGLHLIEIRNLGIIYEWIKLYVEDPVEAYLIAHQAYKQGFEWDLGVPAHENMREIWHLNTLDRLPQGRYPAEWF